MTFSAFQERYALKAVEKRWLHLWGLDTPLALLQKPPVPDLDLSTSRVLVYKDIALRLGLEPLESSVLPENIAPLLPPLNESSNESPNQDRDILSLEEAVSAYGIDAVRLFLVSDNPPDVPLLWNEDALEGAWKFINALWQKFHTLSSSEETALLPPLLKEEDFAPILQDYNQRHVHKALAKIRGHLKTVQTLTDLSFLCTLLAPVAPCIACEMTTRLTALYSEK